MFPVFQLMNEREEMCTHVWSCTSLSAPLRGSMVLYTKIIAIGLLPLLSQTTQEFFDNISHFELLQAEQQPSTLTSYLHHIVHHLPVPSSHQCTSCCCCA